MRRITIASRILTFGLMLLPFYAAGQQAAVDAVEYDAFMREAQQRREAYERYGTVPKVPRSLSTSPDDPDFVFLGFSRYATPEEAEEAMIHSRAPDGAGDEDRTVTQDFGVFIGAAGEMWAWRPRDPNGTVKRARQALRVPASSNDVSAVPGPGVDDDSDTESRARKTRSTERQAILGTDTRDIFSATAGSCMTCFPLRAVGALAPDGQAATNPNAQCTATKIGARHLLTAGHCVHTGGFGGALIRSDWWAGQDGANGTGAAPNGIRNIQWYWVPGAWLASASGSKDYGILILFDAAGTANLGAFGYKVDDGITGSTVWNLGYPGWGNTCAKSTLPGMSCGNSVWGMTAPIALTNASMAYYPHDTQGGHSGGPVYQKVAGNRLIVAVHKGTQSAWVNRGVKINFNVFINIVTVLAQHPSSFN